MYAASRDRPVRSSIVILSLKLFASIYLLVYARLTATIMTTEEQKAKRIQSLTAYCFNATSIRGKLVYV